jgi:peptide/nickel transport system permease protein
MWMAGGDPEHLLGTDQIGRDIFSRMLFGTRIALFVSLGAALIAGTIGTMIGMLAAYRGGRWDGFLSSLMDAQLSLPFILLALAVVATFGVSLLNLLIVLTVTWVSFARTTRARVLELKETEFVAAAYALGATELRIVRLHILPHVLPLVVAVGTLQMGRMILMESALSFLGLGVPADIPSWGGMLSEGRQYVRTAPWLSILPGLAIVILVFSINLVGRGITRRLDPRDY